MSKKSNASKHLVKYSITAIITKIISEGKVVLNGVGKHRYEKSKDEILNLLENNGSVENSKLLELSEPYSIKTDCEIARIFLAMAMLNKKPLKLTIEGCFAQGKSEPEYSITEVEVP